MFKIPLKLTKKSYILDFLIRKHVPKNKKVKSSCKKVIRSNCFSFYVSYHSINNFYKTKNKKKHEVKRKMDI